MQEFAERIPPYQFMTAFPQIISRICHENAPVFEILKVRIAAVFSASEALIVLV